MLADTVETVLSHYTLYAAKAKEEARVILEDQFHFGEDKREQRIVDLSELGLPITKDPAGFGYGYGYDPSIRDPEAFGYFGYGQIPPAFGLEDIHLASYKIEEKVSKKKDSVEDLNLPRTVTNQFGELELTVHTAHRLLVPATKAIGNDPPDDLAEEGSCERNTTPCIQYAVSHFTCYNLTIDDMGTHLEFPYKVFIEDSLVPAP